MSNSSNTTTAQMQINSKKMAEKLPEALKPTDPHPGDDEHMASLREWARQKEFANDNFGGHKGIATGEANDPFKVFRWVGRKLSGQPTDGGRSHKWDTSPLRPDEIPN